ncbi:hypothetical protein SBADM41S_04438 [Streptomyces badius]
MELHDVWFVLIAVLWTGYFFLEGFDFGIGVLTKLLARDRKEKKVLINTIGPVWDGNEVWLLTAGGATFAAFPEWYATLFSGFYLPLLIILFCLIVRGVAFEYRAKRPEERWQTNWETAIFWTSLIPAVLWGVAFGNIVRGVKIDADMEYVGNFWGSPQPVRAILGGLVNAHPLHLPRSGVRRPQDSGRHPGPGPRPGAEAGTRHRAPRAGLPALDPGRQRGRLEPGSPDCGGGVAAGRDRSHRQGT